jgi:hypothetical protein
MSDVFSSQKCPLVSVYCIYLSDMQFFFIWDFLLTGHGHANFFYIFFFVQDFFSFK